jgi:hypothetical protein
MRKGVAYISPLSLADNVRRCHSIADDSLVTNATGYTAYEGIGISQGSGAGRQRVTNLMNPRTAQTDYVALAPVHCKFMLRNAKILNQMASTRVERP